MFNFSLLPLVANKDVHYRSVLLSFRDRPITTD